MNFLTRFRNLAIAGLLGAGVLLGGSQQASAVTFGFDNIAGGSTAGDAYASNFKLDVTDLGAGKVLFQIVSAAAPAMNYFISTIFVDNSAPSSFSDVPLSSDASTSVGNVAMDRIGGGTLPQGTNVGFSSNFMFKRDVPGTGSSIHQGETAGFIFDVVGDFASLIGALTSGELRFGLHLQGLSGGASDSYVNSVTPVPLPAAGILLIGALGGLGFASRRKKRVAV
ncbi:VPLPA-CTERM sorting domain-containing protein [Salipiger sp. HF18]|uniref:VPLPA-CTERM sorting domain-containing protein n=1 Tax=Salipiger sp. HF18 TaxID=2721557 RepID=UPI00142D3823|nr:VPLPA-CTERM sorting domain-containing protein [Salipiger sp. HF18]NIY95193.1 VPLPA-CTERM sorting domain-containing protein [Salipiger sp. HF18]